MQRIDIINVGKVGLLRMYELEDYIEVNRVPDTPPPCGQAFCEEKWQDILCLPASKPEVEQLLNVTANIEVCCTQVVHTSSGVSCEGQILTDRKICVEGKVHLAVEYVSCEASQSVHAAEFIKLFSAFIITPCNFECDTTFEIIPYLEHVFCMSMGCRSLYCSLLFALEMKPHIDELYNGE